MHQPEFDPEDVDHDMHERLMAAIEEGDLQVIDLKGHGDGLQDVWSFKKTSSQGSQGAACLFKVGSAWLGASSLPSRSAKTRLELELLVVTQTAHCHFNWPR